MATQGDGNGSEPTTEEIATDSDMSEEKLAKLVEETQRENKRLQKQKLQELEALKQENQRLVAEISALQRGQRIGGTAGNSNTRATAVAGDPAAGSVNNNAPTIADLRANTTLSMQADNALAALGLVEDPSDSSSAESKDPSGKHIRETGKQKTKSKRNKRHHKRRQRDTSNDSHSESDGGSNVNGPMKTLAPDTIISVNLTRSTAIWISEPS